MDCLLACLLLACLLAVPHPLLDSKREEEIDHGYENRNCLGREQDSSPAATHGVAAIEASLRAESSDPTRRLRGVQLQSLQKIAKQRLHRFRTERGNTYEHVPQKHDGRTPGSTELENSRSGPRVSSPVDPPEQTADCPTSRKSAMRRIPMKLPYRGGKPRRNNHSHPPLP